MFTSWKSPALVAAAAALSVLLSGCQSTGGLGTSGSVSVYGKDAAVSVSFSDHDRRLIREYYAGARRKPLPPGLAKRGRLPPGLEKQLRKNGELPPGLRGRALPRELEAKLTPLPRGYVRVVIGHDIVLHDTRTRVVLDVVKDIF